MTIPAPGTPDFGRTSPEDPVNALARRLTLLERDHKALLRDYEQLRLRVDELEEGAHAWAGPRPDGAGQDNNLHHLIAREFVVLVEQRVQNLARAAARTQPSQDPPEALHRRIGAICRVLFGTAEPSSSALLSAVHRSRLDPLASAAARLCERAQEMRRQRESSVMPASWDFAFTAGAPLDGTWQEPWPGCPAERPGRFVVAPAYLVAEQVYAKQRVHTG
ncbi:hypothetical protein GTY66_08075 [Streptomyces sp. SID8356]|uniref:hypothetical protein n=1 Tax=unclassified Streptomyces TaxID=2593676 RepID=UPI00036ACFC0|nr:MULTISPECIES: hypothetical protein [unclassified Streptomyces]MYT36012.1 hypothetical protein [Streptomyces sp. SID8356]